MTTPTLPPGDFRKVEFPAVARGRDHDFDDQGMLHLVFRYDPADPFAVQIVLSHYRHDPDPSVWTVSRDALFAAFLWGQPSGAGDFRALPLLLDAREGDCSVPSVRLTFSTPTERPYHVDVALDAVAPGLKRMLQMVPLGHEAEHYDMDAVLDRLFYRRPQ